MAKLGGTKHLKRITAPTAVALSDKKSHVWLKKPSPGPHSSRVSMTLGLLISNVLHFAKNAREVKKILAQRLIQVNGIVRTSYDFPIGIMDIVGIPKMSKTYAIVLDSKGRLSQKEVSSANKKLAKITKKYVNKGKISMTTHDGHTMLGSNELHVGDTVEFSLPSYKIENVMKLENGAMCLIMDGKHAGIIGMLKEIIKRKEGKKPEALVSSKAGEFITVAEYLFVVPKDFDGAS